MKKAIDQTIRDLKREVNKKVLKVPGIEQKVLDATSNEPWGPHGAHLAHIAQATRNYHEYQMIMGVLWKRINDTGKNWRHVYKALIVLEYLVAHGSDRVIDEIKEHAYQISTLTGFQYVDSNGRDQGNNVRKKSHSLVVLVNDKERVTEVRQKASVNREKFHGASIYRAGSYSSTGDRYDDDRCGYRDYDRNGYGREREGGKDDGRYGRNIDSYSRDGDRYGKDSDDRCSRYGDEYDDYRGRSRSVDQYPHGSRSRSSDGYRDRTYDDDGRYSARSSGARAEDRSQDDGVHEQKFSEQDTPPPPYEEAVRDSQTPVHDEGNEENAETPAPKASSPTGSTNEADATGTAASPANKEVGGFDVFDPRASDSAPQTAPPTTTQNGEKDFLGSLMDSFTSDALALTAATTSEADGPTSSGQTLEASPSGSAVPNQPFEDPFGDSPFKATQATDGMSNATHDAASTSSIQPSATGQASPNMEANSSMDFGDTFSGLTFDPSFSDQNVDILADILPPTSGCSAPQDSQAAFSAPSGSFVQQQSAARGNFFQQGGYTSSPKGSQGPFHSPPGQHVQQNNNAFANMPPQSPSAASVASNESPPAAATLSTNTQPSPKKFEPKSAVWADTLSKGLVDFNISGPKANPLADIGVDFDTMNRREKRERPASTTNVTSTITMGKAMGAGSGMGRAGSSSLAPPPPNPGMGGGQRMGMGMGMGGNPGMGMSGNPGMGMGGSPGMGMGMAGNPGMGMGMSSNPGMGLNMGGYGSMNQQMGMGGMGMNMGMGMGMNMGQGAPMRPPMGSQPSPNMPGNYNPATGQGGYPQQPYGGYR